MRFAYQAYLLLLVIIPILGWRFFNHRGRSPMVYSDISRIKKVFGVGTKPPLSHYTRNLLYMVRLLVLTLFILALARPQAELITSEIYTEGVDIILTLDVSGSMNYIDLDNRSQANRLEVTKEAVQRFIEGRKNDRIGMVFLDDVYIGMVSETSTAIGSALASSLNRLRYSKAKSKVIVLITDGANNVYQIDPLTASEMAKALGTKIYTIGVGGYGVPYIEVDTIFGKQLRPFPDAERIDEDALRNIAERTGGKFYRASDREKFNEIFSEIDRLEKSEIKSDGNRRFRELFHWFLIPALLLLLIEVILSNTRFRKLP